MKSRSFCRQNTSTAISVYAYCRQSALCRPLGRCPGDCQNTGHRKEDRAEADSGIKRQIRPAGSVRAEAGRKSGGCGGTAGRRTGCLPGCGTGADCAWLLRNGSTAGSKESRNHRRHGQRGCAESGIEAYVLADGPKLWKKETL